MDDPPLVASDHDDAGTPLLSSCSHIHSTSSDDESSSPMMIRLMQRRAAVAEIEPTMMEQTGEGNDFFAQQQERQERLSTHPFSLTVVLAGTLTLAQCVLVWTAYLSDSWSDVHVLTTIGWQQQYLPFLNDYTNYILQTMDLGWVVSVLRASQNFGLLVLVVATAVVLPCLAILVNPMLLVAKYYYTVVGWRNGDTGSPHGRMSLSYSGYWHSLFLPLTIRTSLVIVYLFVLLHVTNAITMEWKDTVIEVQNCMRGALLSYLLGMTAAMGALVMTLYCNMDSSTNRNIPQQQQRAYSLSLLQQQIVSPPPAAFRYAWPVFEMEMYRTEDDDEIADPHVTRPSVAGQQQQEKRGRWYSCVTWQLGLATGVLLLPSFSLPIASLSYQGLAAEFMAETRKEIYLWQLPRLLWQHGPACTDNKQWMAVTFQVVFILQVAVLPLVGLLCGLASLCRRSSSAANHLHCYRKCLSCVRPMMNGISFACTVILFTPALESIAPYLWNEEEDYHDLSLSSSGLCETFHRALGESCLTVSGAVLPGSWFLLAQSLLLEVFCAMVLSSSNFNSV